jgi:DNA-binding response OmpR family regulator
MIARTENPLSFRPRLVLAYNDSARAALTSRHFRRLGWEVHQACSGPEARRLVYVLRPQVVILDADLRDESGWLTCAKLTLGGGGPRAILVSAEVTSRERAFAETVGAAAIIPAEAALPGLMQEVHEAAVAAVG